MFRVLTCLTDQHDFRLVFLAAVICAAAAFTSFHIYLQASNNRNAIPEMRNRRVFWIGLTGLSTGAGIWATHFVAELAYQPGLQTAYDPTLTIASLLIAIVVTTAGYGLAANGGIVRAAGGGAIVGAGIGLMHFTGMAALMVPGVLQWDAGLVAISILVGIALTSLAMVGHHQFDPSTSVWLAPALLTLAICALHFTAMGAVTIIPDATIAVHSSAMNNLSVAVAIAGATILVIIPALASARAAGFADRIKAQEEQLRAVAQRDAALNNMSQGLAMFDAERRLVVCNQRYVEMYSLQKELVTVGTPHEAIVAHHGATAVAAAAADQGAAGKLCALNPPPIESSSSWVEELTDGRVIRVSHRPMDGGGWVATHEDVTGQRRSEAKIIHMALHDALTDLPNRVLLRERLQHSLEAVRRGDCRVSILLLDLDRFKEINDTLGHSTGDALLQAVVGRLRTCATEADVVARLGGDEFAILNIADEAASEAAALAEKIQAALSTPFDLDHHQVLIGTSIGIAIGPAHGTDPDELMRFADLALYQAKSDGRGTHCFFEPEMDQLVQSRRDLERDLRNALVNGELVLHYQPLVDLRTSRICGFEALLRWRHPVRGMMSPAEFIPVAEDTGLIDPIGEWVLRTACAEAAGWPAYIKVAVNLSPSQFRRRQLVAAVSAALANSGIAPKRLEIEITETVMLRDDEVTFSALSQLRDLGVQIALDDFGTGFSSLSSLRKFPFDRIKIDRTFVSELSHASVDALAIVRSVVQLAAGLGKSTTAEGVETKEQMETVRAMGCSEMQGYYYSRPKPASEIARMLSHESTQAASAA